MADTKRRYSIPRKPLPADSQATMASVSSQKALSDNAEKKTVNSSLSINSPVVQDPPQAFDGAATKKLVRKLDLHLIPYLATIYLQVFLALDMFHSDRDRLCFLDRTNVGNARLEGLEDGAHLVGLDYNNALAIFFPFYIAAEIPSNMAMNVFRPSVWITCIMLAWSIIVICMGFVYNYRGLMAARVFLGITEGGLFPGICFLITIWYRRHETGLRMAMFFSAATAAGAFGGLLARAIAEMNGVAGMGGWAWIFILEGILTFVVGSTGFWFIHDSPAT